MIMGLSETEFQAFFERISATAIANQAIIKCQLTGMPVTVDNVILFVGDFIDPGDERFKTLIGLIAAAITEVIDMPWVHRIDKLS